MATMRLQLFKDHTTIQNVLKSFQATGFFLTLENLRKPLVL